jgi:N-acetylneuraminic acid mutarotase
VIRNFAALALAFATLILAATSLHAQVPQLINYQGRVAVGGTNFTGTGQFRFALVNTNGSTSYWSNDGTSTAGSPPTNAVSLTVTNGLYSVLLGDTTLTNMTAIPPSVFSNGDVRLRVWFNDGTNGSQLLTPDQRIAAVGYAVMAGNVPDGSITSAKIASGAVTSTQLATGAAAANLASSSQSAVGTGGVVLSSDPASAGLLAAGYSKVGESSISLGETWTLMQSTGAPSGRGYHSGVWTGSQLIVWGGYNGTTYLNDGGRYNPVSDSWTPMTSTNAPSPRYKHQAVWTGSVMIVWGGNNGVSQFNTGGQYNPTTDVWTPTSTVNAPSARTQTAMAWTGTEMIVWGGVNRLGTCLGDGARYNPITDTWTTMSTTGAPSVRAQAYVVWTGSEMIVWAGSGGPSVLNDGARYNPTTDTWNPITSTNAPSARQDQQPVAVWTGSSMVIWGGYNNGTYPADGGSYNLSANTWTTISATGAPTPRADTFSVWTGKQMLVWGGFGGTNLATGAYYTPATDSWTATSTANISARSNMPGLWTGGEIIIWGGGGFNADGSRLTPANIFYLYRRN